MVALYYPLSVGLTFYQKWFIKVVIFVNFEFEKDLVLGIPHGHYRLPLFIVTGHYVTKYLMAIAIRSIVEFLQKNRRVRVPLREQLRWLMPIGFCASLDIGLSNWSLEYVTVSLYTMAKSSSILFIVGFSLFLKLERWHSSLGVSAFLIAVGLFLFTLQSTQLDFRGLVLVEMAALCTGFRWTISQLIMQGEECSTPVRHPLDMMIAVQPWMFIAIVPIVIVAEGPEMTLEVITSFHNEYEPALECISLLLAHQINGDRLSDINIVGLVLCVLGMTLHSITKHTRHKSAVLSSPTPSRCNSQSLSSPSSSPQSMGIGRRGTCGKINNSTSKKVVELEDRRKLLIPEQTII
uniref:Sugar phosphate transporter domain-containing protein n=1 Tax=Meloidogyne javanica TaxID=6303 RepID=A0A915N0S8_MELJA